MKWLNEIAKHHSKWVSIAKHFGMEHPEDVVQDFYIELVATSKRKFKPNDKRFNPDFAGLTFEQKVITNGSLNQGFLYLIFRRVISTAHRKRRVDNLEILADPKQEETNTEHLNELECFYNRIDDVLKDCYWYDKVMLKTYIETGFSMRKLAKETGIPYRSVHYAINKAKKILKDELKDEYNKLKLT